MAFALTQFKAYGIRTSGETRQHTWQVADMGITALNTDVTLDISSDTTGSLGTFWTAAIANATYGQLATNALAKIQAIIGITNNFTLYNSEALSLKSKLVSGVTGGNVSFLSAASVGGSPTEAYTVTGLLATDTVLSVTPQTATANVVPQIIGILSGTISTGTTTTATVAGLASTDVILAVTQSVANANGVVPVAYSYASAGVLNLTYEATSGANGKVFVVVQRNTTGFLPVVAYTTPPTANTLSVTYPYDPGAGAKVEVVVSRTGAAETPSAGQYEFSLTSHLPKFVFASGDAPTSQILRLVWQLQDGQEAIVADYGAAF